MNQAEKDAACCGAILQALVIEIKGLSDEILGNYLSGRSFDVSITDVRSYLNYLVDGKYINYVLRPLIGPWIVRIAKPGTDYLAGRGELDDPGVTVMR